MPKTEMTYIDAIRSGLDHLLKDHKDVVVYGQDVGAFGGAFKATLGLQEKYGTDRVFDTPISESALLGSAIGMAMQGLRPIVEIQFVDFITTAFHQILNNAGTTYYRTKIPVPMTVRAPCGGGFGGGPFHSEELENFFCHIPGIKVVYPAYPSDARGLLYSAVLDPNPVIFLENKFLYRRIKEFILPKGEAVPIGVAQIRRTGNDAVILTYGAMVHESLHAAEQISAEGFEVMVVDLRTLKPYDIDTILSSVAATNRVMVVHEAWKTGGFGAELAALVAEHAFHLLDAPIVRITAPDCPVPFSPELERVYRPSVEKISEALLDLINY